MPELAGARARVKARMVEMGTTGTLLRDPAERTDDVMDPDTLALSSPAGDATVVYGPDGPCWAFHDDGSQDWGDGDDRERPHLEVAIPFDASPPVVGDRWVVTACADEQLVFDGTGPLWRVVRIRRSAVDVLRRFWVVQVGPPAPST